MALPWLTSNTLIESVQRNISFPLEQVTFTEDDILAFANEEIAIGQVPGILEYHQEFFVFREVVPLEANRSRYPIPDRAIGMKIRDVFYMNTNGDLSEMTRISPDDQAFHQRTSGLAGTIYKFYFEGNDVVLSPSLSGTDTVGSLLFTYFIRPNQLVQDDRAAVVSSFKKEITVDNSSLVAGDVLAINNTSLTAVAGAPSTNEFQIGGTSILTATNLVAAINTAGLASASNGAGTLAIVTIDYSNRNLSVVSTNEDGLDVSENLIINCVSVPENITTGSIIDLLQTKGGHKTLSISIPVINLSTNLIYVLDSLVSNDIVVGDYVSSEYECIIPQIPSDLHTGLVERTSSRILSAIGDAQGLSTSMNRLKEIEQRQGTLIDNRAEGAPMKVTNRRSLLRNGKMGYRRRF